MFALATDTTGAGLGGTGVPRLNVDTTARWLLVQLFPGMFLDEGQPATSVFEPSTLSESPAKWMSSMRSRGSGVPVPGRVARMGDHVLPGAFGGVPAQRLRQLGRHGAAVLLDAGIPQVPRGRGEPGASLAPMTSTSRVISEVVVPSDALV